MPLPPIPCIETPDGVEPAEYSAQVEPERLALLIDSASRTYTHAGMRIADNRSRAWAARWTSPYAEAVHQVHRAIHRPGAYLLNYSYEWGCTSGVADDTQKGPTLLRTLDWPFNGLGRALIAAQQKGPAGRYLNITWPGFAGVLTAVAPGRFAAAINQPPLPYPGRGKAIGWVANRVRVSRSAAMPPSHLLRLAFDTARDFTEAVTLIRETPICLPAIFTIGGTTPGQTVVIERTQTAAYEPDAPTAANHWAASPGPQGRPRNASSLPRRAAMTELCATGAQWSLDWVSPPLLQKDTRLAAMACAKDGRVLIQGWEKDGPATAVLDLALT